MVAGPRCAYPGAMPLPMLLDWMEESFCAVAPKKVAAGLAGRSAAAPARKRR